MRPFHSVHKMADDIRIFNICTNRNIYTQHVYNVNIHIGIIWLVCILFCFWESHTCRNRKNWEDSVSVSHIISSEIVGASTTLLLCTSPQLIFKIKVPISLNNRQRLCSKCHTIILLLLFLQHAVCMLRIVCTFSVCMKYPDDLIYLPESAKYTASTQKSVQKLCSEWHTTSQLLLYCSMLCEYCE